VYGRNATGCGAGRLELQRPARLVNPRKIDSLNFTINYKEGSPTRSTPTWPAPRVRHRGMRAAAPPFGSLTRARGGPCEREPGRPAAARAVRTWRNVKSDAGAARQGRSWRGAGGERAPTSQPVRCRPL